MKTIIDYKDYRKYIQDYYDERKRSSAFTWREFAMNAGFSSAVYLKYVCEGKKNLSCASAGQVAVAMGLSGFEMAYFNAMVAYSHAKNDKAKKFAFEEMCAIANEHKVKILGEDEFEYFKSWKNPVLRELAPHMPGAKPLDMAHVCRPKISAAEVTESINLLLKLQLLQKDKDGNYQQTQKSVSMGDVDAVPVAAREMQRQMGEFALEALEDLPLSERDMSGLTLGLTRRGYERIRHELAEFRRRVVSIATEDDETESVYRLNLQLFPLTENLKTEVDK